MKVCQCQAGFESCLPQDRSRGDCVGCGGVSPLSVVGRTQHKEVFAEAAAVASPLHPDTLVTRYRPGFLSGAATLAGIIQSGSNHAGGKGKEGSIRWTQYI